jgi:hypothetical protein
MNKEDDKSFNLNIKCDLKLLSDIDTLRIQYCKENKEYLMNRSLFLRYLIQRSIQELSVNE